MRQSRSRLVWVLPLCLAVPPCTRAQSTEHDSFILAGRVTNSVTGEAVNRALVTAIGNAAYGVGAESGVRSSAVPRQMLTDIGGTFRFVNLPAGMYQLSVWKPHFQPRSPEQFDSLTVGPSREDLQLRIEPLAVIEGIVLDATGSPVGGVNIQALQDHIRSGSREVQEERSVTTDDRGRYRLWNLDPGKYYIRAAGRSGGTRRFIGEYTPLVEWNESSTVTYFGGAHTLASATPLTVIAGQQVQADLTVATVPAFRIRGSVENFVADQPVTFELFLTADEKLSSRVAYNATSGRFEINDVVPGSYRLRATQGQAGDQRRAEIDLLIQRGDVNDVVLPLTAGVDVKAALHCEGDAQPPRRIPCWAQIILIDSTAREINARAAEGADFVSTGSVFSPRSNTSHPCSWEALYSNLDPESRFNTGSLHPQSRFG